MSPTIKAIVLFSGPGGTTQGIKDAGIDDTIGVEWDESAVATAVAAGHNVVQADVRTLDPIEFFQKFDLATAPIGATDCITKLLLQGSPPCQGLSKAGKGKGREDLDRLLAAVLSLKFDEQDEGGPRDWAEVRDLIPEIMEDLIENCSDERSPLTFEVMRWIFDLDPEYVSLEQVPAALVIWEAICEVLKSWGYSVWCGNVQAEQFGVPQTRKRAIMLASRGKDVTAPIPTHSKYHNRNPSKLDEGMEKWVSMAEALGWGFDGVMVSNYGSGGDPKNRGTRELVEPAPTVTSKIGRNKIHPTHMGDVYNSKGCIRSIDEPAPTMTASMDNGNFQFFDEENPPAKVVDRLKVKEIVEPRVNNQSGTEFDLSWPSDRPAPVIAGRDIVTMPGANANRFNGSTKSRNDGIRVTVQEAGVLQSFPADWPWQGTKTKQFEQVGNAVPPLLQRALTLHLV